MIDDSALAHLFGPAFDKSEWSESDWNVFAAQLNAIARVALKDLAKDDLEDLVQLVILRFIERPALRRQVGESQHVAPYLFRIVRNAGLDLLRWRQRHATVRYMPVVVARAHDPILALHEELVARKLDDIIRRLPPDDFELLRMRFWDGLKLREMADRRGKAVSTLAYRLVQIVASIRRQLDEL